MDSWNATLLAAAGYGVVVGLVAWLLPMFDEVPAGFPGDLLWEFRIASLTVQTTLWLVAGLVLAALIHAVYRRTVAGRHRSGAVRHLRVTSGFAESAVLRPPSAATAQLARDRCDALAKPTGALGRLEDLAIWWAACQDRCPPEPVRRPSAVVFAGDHGVSEYGVSAYPREVTAAMVAAFLSGRAGVAVLARQHDVRLRVLDIGVDSDLPALTDQQRADVTRYKIRRSSGPIQLTDALTAEQTVQRDRCRVGRCRRGDRGRGRSVDRRGHGHRQHHPGRRADRRVTGAASG